VLPKAITLQLTRIRLVVPDDEITLGVEALEQRLGERKSLFHSTPTCHGRGISFQLSVKEWIESSIGGVPLARHWSMTASMAR
jgi:hypothetical protein